MEVNQVLEEFPKTAWVVNKEMVKVDLDYMFDKERSFQEVKYVFDEQRRHYQKLRSRIMQELARFTPYVEQMVQRRNTHEQRRFRHSKVHYRFTLPEEWKEADPESYADMLDQASRLATLCLALHEILPDIQKYFSNQTTRARRYGLLLEQKPFGKYKLFSRSKPEREQGILYAPLPLLMRNMIGPSRNINFLHYSPGRPGYKVWERMIRDLIQYDLVGRELIPAKMVNVFGEEESMSKALFMENLCVKGDRNGTRMAAVRLDVVYAIVQTRSEEDQQEFEFGFQDIVDDAGLDDETYENVMRFVKEQWEQVYKQTDVMEYWNIR